MTKLPRRRFQFTVRALLVATLLVAIPCASWGNKRHRYRTRWKRHLAAVADLEKNGGYLVYRGAIASEDVEPGWVRRLLGHRYFEYVLGFVLEGACDDSTLQQLTALSDLQIEVVHVFNCPVTDKGLGYVKDFPSVWAVRLERVDFSEAGLAHLQQVPRLRKLTIHKDTLTEGEMAQIGQLSGLRWLNLDGAQIGEGGIAHLESLGSLEMLILDNTNITSAELTHLEGLANLKILYLKNTRIADDGLRHLKNLSRLEGLFLDNTKISDAGLKWLEDLRNLRVLHTYGTTATDQGLDSLRKVLPDVEIDGVEPGEIAIPGFSAPE